MELRLSTSCRRECSCPRADEDGNDVADIVADFGRLGQPSPLVKVPVNVVSRGVQELTRVAEKLEEVEHPAGRVEFSFVRSRDPPSVRDGSVEGGLRQAGHADRCSKTQRPFDKNDCAGHVECSGDVRRRTSHLPTCVALATRW